VGHSGLLGGGLSLKHDGGTGAVGGLGANAGVIDTVNMLTPSITASAISTRLATLLLM
jgi:hypothetical protein